MRGFHRTQSALFTASFFFFSFFFPNATEIPYGMNNTGVAWPGCRGGGRSEVGGVRWSGWLCCGNRRPEHQSGVSRWRGGRSGWKGQRVRRANKLIFVVVHSLPRAHAREPSSPGSSKEKERNSHVALWRTLVVHAWGTGRKEILPLGNFWPTARSLESNDDVTPRCLMMTNYWPPFLSWCYYLLHVAFITSKSNVTNEIFTCRWSQMIWDRGEDNGSKLSEKQKH